MTIDPALLTLSTVEAFDRSVAAAQHLDERHLGAIVNARNLAWKVDEWQRIAARAIEDADEAGDRPRVPQNDNVSPSAFAKACDALGLTPIGAKAIEAAKYGQKPADGGTNDGGNGEASATEGRVHSIAERRSRAQGSA